MAQNTEAGVKPASSPNIIHDDKYNVDVYPAPFQDAQIDILVPVHSRLDLTMGCIKAIYEGTRTPFHLIVLDDSPFDDYRLTERYIHVLQSQRNNITYCLSRIPYKDGNTFFNVGIKYSRTPYIATIMNSMTVRPLWEVIALQMMEQDPQIGTIGFKCLFSNGLIESAGIAFIGWVPTDIARDMQGYDVNETRECEAVQWAFALHRKQAIDGAIEEGLFNGHVGWDDIDNCWAVRKRGWKVMYCGQGVGIHQPRATRGSNSVDALLRNQENSHIFFKRWGLWEKYLEASNMNVADMLKHDTKDALSGAVQRIQVLRQLLKEAEMEIQPLANAAMKELGIDPAAYLLDMDPAKNSWVIRPNAQAIAARLNPVEVKPASDTKVETLEGTKEEVKV